VKRNNRQRRRPILYKNLTCALCTSGIGDVSYKDVYRLNKFTTAKGRILPSARTGTCARHQRKVTRAIKLARHMALLPFVIKE